MIDPSKLSDAELAGLIAAAMTEFQRRQISAPGKPATLEPPQIAPTAPAKRPVKTPTESDQRFVRACLRLLRTKGYIKAADKDHYRAVVKKHPRWTKIQGYPDSLRGSTADHWLDFNNPLDDK